VLAACSLLPGGCDAILRDPIEQVTPARNASLMRCDPWRGAALQAA